MCGWRQPFFCISSLGLFGLCCYCLAAKSCLTLSNPMDCSPPGSSVHGISQARTLEWVAISFSGESSQPRDWTGASYVSGIDRWVLSHWVTRESPCLGCYNEIPYIGWFIDKRKLFLIVWRLGSLRSRQEHGHILVRVLFLVHSQPLFIVSSHGRRGRVSLWGLIYKNYIPIVRVSGLWPKHFPQIPHSNTSHWAFWSQPTDKLGIQTFRAPLISNPITTNHSRIKSCISRNFLVVQQLKLHSSTEGGTISSLAQGPKISHAKWHSQNQQTKSPYHQVFPADNIQGETYIHKEVTERTSL